MQRLSNQRVLMQLRRTLLSGGMRAAIIFLNHQTTFRFTAVYRFDRDTLHNLCFYDRQSPHIESSPDIPVLASYCVFVRDLKQTFSMVNSHRDERVRDHPKRISVQAYCGVPLLDNNGNMFGSICHFNIEPMPIDEMDVALLEMMGGLITEHEQRERVACRAQ